MKTKEEILEPKMGDMYYVIGKYRKCVFEAMEEYKNQFVPPPSKEVKTFEQILNEEFKDSIPTSFNGKVWDERLLQAGERYRQQFFEAKEVKSAEEIFKKRIHDVENGIFSCEDRVCDVANEILQAAEEHAQQFQSTPISQKFIDFMKGFFVSEIIHMESQLRSYNTSPSKAEDLQEKIDAYGGFLTELSNIKAL